MIPNILLRSIRRANSGQPPVEPDADFDNALYYQFRFADNEAINEVTETFAALNGSAFVENNKLKTAAVADTMSFETALFTANSFTIQTKFNYVSTSANIGLIGVWNGNGNVLTRWYLLWEAAAGGLRLYFRNATGQIAISAGIGKPAANTDHHIEVGYDGTNFYIFFNGTLLNTVAGDGVNAPAVASLPQTEVIGAGNTFNGHRWDTNIYIGRCLHTQSFTPTALDKAGRTTYDQATSNVIRVQADLRRDNAINEANGHGIQMYGTARVAQGAIVQTAATSSYYSMLMEPFGAGDFTIELEFNLSSIHATYGSYLAGQWVRGITASPDNCWLVYVSAARAIQFSWGRSAQASDVESIASTDGAFLLNAKNKVVIERVGTTLTIYMNNVQVAQGTCAIPLRTNYPSYCRSLSSANLAAHAGKIWNIRIADKAMYNGVVKSIPQFPKLLPRPTYDPAILEDIVCQCSLRNGNPRNEKTGQMITTAGTGVVLRDGISTTLVNTSRFYIPVSHFGAADFTIEMKLTMISSTGASTRPIFGQFRGGSEPNSWIFYTLGSNIAFQALDQDGGTVTIDSATVGKTWVANTEYHVIVERVGTTVSMYIDNVLIGSGTLAGNLVNMDAYPNITNLYDTSTAKFCASSIRDVRIAKRALFNGNVNRQPFPEIPNQKPSLMMTTASSPALQGAAQNLSYLSGLTSAGVFSHTLFRDVRDPQNVKTVRLVALVNDRSYTVIAFRESAIPPTEDMPQFTNSLKIGENSPVLISNTSGASVQGGPTGRYWSGNLLGTNVQGKCIPFEFV